MNKTVLITGASSGIGKETAFVYAENNYNLILVARRLENLKVIKQKIETKHKVSVQIMAMDLSKLNSAEALFDNLLETDLQIDVLINNAGFGIFKYFADSDIEKEEQMLLLNVVTLTKLTKLLLPQMIERKSGHIINIASSAAYQAVPSLASYAATKAYVLNFSEGIAFELKDKNVNVTVICPGGTQSEFGHVAGFTEDDKFFNKMPTAKNLAEFIYKAMKNKKVNAIHGFKNKFLQFIGRFAPRKFTSYMAYKVMNK